MDFNVDLGGLDGLTRLLDRGAEDAVAVRQYMRDNGGIDFTGEGLINLFSGTADDVERDLDKYLSQLATGTMPGTAAAVGGAERYYRATDTESAAKLDRAMPDVDVTAAARGMSSDRKQPATGSQPFADVSEPTAALIKLPDYNAQMPYEPTWYDLASPTSLLRDAVWSVTRLGVALGICDRTYDIFEVVLKPVLGDWAGMAATGDAMKQVSQALGGLRANLAWATQTLPAVWQGNAADAAAAHLYRIQHSLSDAEVSLVTMGGEYNSAAQSAYAFSTTVGALLADVTDAAVAAAASAAASGAVASTGVGVPLALLLGAFALTRIYRVISALYTIIKIIADLRARIDALRKAVESARGDFGRITGSFSASPLPPVPSLPC